MHNGKLISIGNILWRVMRQPIAAELSYEQAAEFALEFIRLVGAPLAYIDKVESLELVEYKAIIPSNLIDVRGVRYTGPDGCQEGTAMRYATDLYHLSDKNGHPTELTYVLQNCILTASIKGGFIEISYRAIATDESGYPMVPDNESFKMGLEYYILHRFVEPLWTMGKIQDKVFQYYEQKRHWYLGQAASSMIVQGPDQLESIMNGLNRLIIQDQSFDTFYRNFGEKERLKRFN
jgi:hypothetical protein